MKKKYEVRHIVTAVASIPVYKAYSKTETYRQAAKDGWGTVYRDENNALVCDEDCSASLYTKNGGYFGIFSYEEINTKELPKQAACAAIIVSDSCGFTFWAEDFNQIHIFVTYDENGLVDTYRVEYGDSPIYDGEVEISFEDLYERAEDDWQETYRAELPGTVEYQHKREAAEVAAKAAATAGQKETWMNAAQQVQFRRVCGLLDSIKTDRDFYRVMDRINSGEFDLDVVNTAREVKECYNSGQYEQTMAQEAAQEERDTDTKAKGKAGGLMEIPCCPVHGVQLIHRKSGTAEQEYCGTWYTCPEGGCGYTVLLPSAEISQRTEGTAAEAASEGQQAALGTPDGMAGTDATEAGSGQQAAPQAGEINLGKLVATLRPKAGGGLRALEPKPP